MGDLDRRTFLITGADTGIGKETARALASRGARVHIACRSEEKGRKAMQEIAAQTGSSDVSLLSVDLGDLGSVRAAAREFLARDEPLHVLINNAGLAGRHGKTASGFEAAFGTNHVGPFLLTSLLLDRIRESAPARIVNVASAAHYGARGIDFDAVRKPTRAWSLPTFWRRVPWPARAVMKRRMVSPEEGARTSLYCATAAELADQSGLYYDECAVKQPGAAAGAELAGELWRRSAEWVGTD